MKFVKKRAALASVGLVVSATALAGGISAASASASSASRHQLTGSLTPAKERSAPQGTVPASTPISFDLTLQLRSARRAAGLVKAVSNPESAQFRHYLTRAQWNATYAPSPAEVSAASAWLSQQGFSVGAVPSDRMFVPAQGTAAQVEKAFSTTLRYYEVNGAKVYLASGQLSVPSSVAGSVSGAVGVNEYLASTSVTTGEGAAKTTAAPSDQEPPPPAGFRNPEPCSSYWGEKTDTRDSASLYAPYKSPLKYDICGYVPRQLRGGYGIDANKDDGTGATVAIVDAYDSPTLLSDAQQYFKRNDPAHPLVSSQFTNVEPSKVDNEAECAASGWYAEQALDVEASHAMAPGAGIEFVGAQNCLNSGLIAALDTAVTSGASVVSNSYGDDEGDLLDDSATKTAFDNVFIEADVTGVSVLFSSGDQGDNFADFGITAPDYPSSSPYVTAVGGTILEVGNNDKRLAEYGWSTGSQLLCASSTPTCGTAKTPLSKLGFNAGGGGGTSYYYTEPYYQDRVVPPDLALRNQALFGPQPLRVIPDISMDADAQSGMLIGLTQTFPDGVYYDQFKEGGTSLASPLLAGVVADADGAGGTPLGFLNPALYKAYQSKPIAFNDIVAPANPLSAAVARVNYADSVDSADGYDVFMRTFDYQGEERFCDGTGTCEKRDVALSTTPGFDSMTGLGTVAPSFIGVMQNF